MSPFDLWRATVKYRYQTGILMRRYRAQSVYLWTEAELRAAWGDR